eukprot:scpid108129/ scgid14167/ 
MGTPGGILECVDRDSYEKQLAAPIAFIEELMNCFGGREEKKRIREQLESISSAKKEYGEQLAEAQKLSQTAKSDSTAFSAKLDVDSLLDTIFDKDPEDPKKLVNELPESERQSEVKESHELLKYCRRIEDCVAVLNQSLTDYNKAKKVLEKLMDMLEKDQEKIDPGRNMAAN